MSNLLCYIKGKFLVEFGAMCADVKEAKINFLKVSANNNINCVPMQCSSVSNLKL
jgi:hypothetical protein